MPLRRRQILLPLIVFGSVATAAATIAVLALAGAPADAYRHFGLGFGVAVIAIGLAWFFFGSDERGLPTVLAGVAAWIATGIAALSVGAGALLLAVFALWAAVWLPARTRTVHLRIEVEISRDPATVFAFASDMRNYLRYMPGVESVEQVGEGAIAAGTRFRATGRIEKEDFDELFEVAEYDPPRRFGWRSADDPEDEVETMTFAATNGSTRVTQELADDVSYASALIGVTLLFPISRWMTSGFRKKGWARMKQVLETGASA